MAEATAHPSLDEINEVLHTVEDPELRMSIAELGLIYGVEDVEVNLVWDPPWDPKTMASDEVKLMLGIW